MCPSDALKQRAPALRHQQASKRWAYLLRTGLQSPGPLSVGPQAGAGRWGLSGLPEPRATVITPAHEPARGLGVLVHAGPNEASHVLQTLLCDLINPLLQVCSSHPLRRRGPQPDTGSSSSDYVTEGVHQKEVCTGRGEFMHQRVGSGI